MASLSFEPHVRRGFAWYTGKVLLRYPYHIIVVSIIVTLLLGKSVTVIKRKRLFSGGGFYFIPVLKVEDSTSLYVPADAPSTSERKLLDELWPIDENEFSSANSLHWKRHVIIRQTFDRSSLQSFYGNFCLARRLPRR